METASGSRALVVDDDSACRALVVSLLERIGCVTYEASTGTEALSLAASIRPALVVLDIGIPGITGYEVCFQLRERYGKSMSIVFLSGARVESLDRVAGLLIGADDYVVKPFDPDELVARLRRLLPRDERRNRRRSGTSPIRTLTHREREVLTMLARGRNQRQIAGDLYISPKTVATHIQRTLAKLGVHSRAAAVAIAHRERLVGDTENYATSMFVRPQAEDEGGSLAAPLASSV